MFELLFIAAMIGFGALAVFAVHSARRAHRDAEQARQDAHHAQRRIDQYEQALRLVDQDAAPLRHRRHLRSVKGSGPANGRLHRHANEHPAGTAAVASTLAAVAGLGLLHPVGNEPVGDLPELPTVPNIPVKMLDSRVAVPGSAELRAGSAIAASVTRKPPGSPLA